MAGEKKIVSKGNHSQNRSQSART